MKHFSLSLAVTGFSLLLGTANAATTPILEVTTNALDPKAKQVEKFKFAIETDQSGHLTALVDKFMREGKEITRRIPFSSIQDASGDGFPLFPPRIVKNQVIQVLTIRGSKLDSKSGGTIELRYLYNGAPVLMDLKPVQKTFTFQLDRGAGDKWILTTDVPTNSPDLIDTNKKTGRLQFRKAHFKANYLGQVLGISRIEITSE